MILKQMSAATKPIAEAVDRKSYGCRDARILLGLPSQAKQSREVVIHANVIAG
jgi:hypothetical protein